MELKKICSGGMVLMALLAFLPLAQAKDFAVQIDATGEAAPRPQDDFYLSVNNQWLRDTPIPPEEKRVETFSLLDLKVRQQLAEITRTAVADAAAGTAGNDEKNIAALYGCLQDKERRGNAGLGQLEQSLRQVEQAATPQEYANTMAALSRKLGLHSIIGSFAVDKEPLQNEVYTVWLQAPDTGLQRDFLAEKANEPYFEIGRAHV
jgi:predicted metalloendopeptidase